MKGRSKKKCCRLVLIFFNCSSVMSLFPSAFHTNLNAGPSTKLPLNVAVSKPHKRKRPSANNGVGERDDQLRATQKNLERLMRRVDQGGVNNDIERKLAMGSLGKVGATKKRKQEGLGKRINPHDGMNLRQESKIGSRSPGTTTKVQGIRGAKKDRKVLPGTGRERLREELNTAKSASSGLGSSPPSKPAPARLAAPRVTTTSNLNRSEGSEDGLTDMQKGMKAKLEGARFR